MILAVNSDSLGRSQHHCFNQTMIKAYVGEYCIVIRSRDYRQTYAVGTVQDEGIERANTAAC
jgi:hypothetical protein